jgi:hypothetical protein
MDRIIQHGIQIAGELAMNLAAVGWSSRILYRRALHETR